MSSKAKIVALALPKSGQHLVVDASSSESFALKFDEKSAVPSRVANDLVFKAINSSITITKFFEVAKSEFLPSIKLTSGETLGAVDYLRSAAPSINMMVSAPVIAVQQSLGLTIPTSASSMKYADDTSTFDVSAKSVPSQALLAGGGLRNISPLTVSVYESHLSSGSQSGKGSTIQAIKIPTGYTVVTGAPWQLQGDGSYIQQGNFGKFTYSLKGGLIYTLEKNTLGHNASIANDSVPESILLQLKDIGSGQTTIVSCTANIFDDNAEISMFSRTGQVESGDSFTGPFSFNFGADGAQLSNGIILEFTVNGVTTKLVNQSIGSSIRLVDSNGVEYGTLTLAPNGDGKTFLFKAEPNIEVALSLRVSAVDGDGDIKHANSVSFKIVKPSGPDSSKVIGDGGNEIVDESHLLQGTDPSSQLLVKNISLPSEYVVDTTIGWGPVTGQPGVFMVFGTYGRLTYNAGTNTLTYTLTSKFSHQTGDGKNIGIDDFRYISLKDANGNTYDVPCKIQIMDDVPLLSLVAEGTEVASGSEAHGSWDIDHGVDGKASLNASVLQFTLEDGTASAQIPFSFGVPIAVTIGGVNYGTLVLTSTGVFTFKAVPNVEEKINFYLGATDTDGDFIQSTNPAYVLIVKPGNPNWVIGMQDGESFDESHLATGTSSGAGSLKHDLSLPAGYTLVVEKGGWTLDNGKYVLTGEAGVLVYDKATNILSYELNSVLSHGTPGTGAGVDNFGTLVIVDMHGNEFDTPCQIVLHDDAPEVAFSSNASAVMLGDTATGAWDIDFGADGKAAANSLQLKIALWGVEAESLTIDDVQFGTSYPVIVGVDYYGTIIVLADGSFSFETASYARQARLTISLGATDGDGDFVAQSINLILDTPHVQAEHTIIGKEVLVDEANLLTGSLGNTSALTQVVALPAGSSIDTSAAAWIQAGDTHTLQGQYGYLTFKAGVLTYTLRDAYAHTVQGADSGYDSMYVPLIGPNGGTQVIVICKIEIKDDIPVVEVLADNTQIEAGDTVTGTWNVAFGADGKAVTDTPYVVKVTLSDGVSGTVSVALGGTVEVIAGGNRYGFLTLNANGTFEFETQANLHDTVLSVSIGAYDSELDLGESNFVVVIDKQAIGPVVPPDVPVGAGTSFNEANLINGTSPNTGALTQEFTVPGGFTVQPNAADGWLAVAGQSGVFQIQGAYGVLVYNSHANTLHYTLTKASPLHDEQGRDSIIENLGTDGKLTLVDGKGNTYKVVCKTEIVDDMPVAGNLGTGVDIDSGGSFNGSYQALLGADGLGVAGKIVLNVLLEDKTTLSIDISAGAGLYEIGTFGSIRLNADGTFLFKAKPNVEATLKLGFEIVDGDGDIVTSLDPTIININKPIGPGPIGINPGEEASESFLPDGTAPDASKCIIELSLPADYDIKTTGSWQSIAANEYKLVGEFGYLTYNSNTKELSYTLTDPAAHVVHDLTTIDDFGRLVLVDTIGNEYNVPCKVTVEDDAPVVTLTTGSDEVISGSIVTGAWSVAYGADGAATNNPLQMTINANGKEAEFTNVMVGVPVAVLIDGVDYGTLTLNSNGSFSFNTKNDMPSTKFEISLGALDHDNDYREELITLTVTNGDKPIIGGKTEEWFNEANLSDGTSTAPLALEKELEIPAGYSLVIDSSWVSNGGTYTLSGPNGHLTWNGSKLTYTLSNKYEHADAGRDTTFQDMGQLTLSKGGVQVKADCIIEIRDDVPVVSISSAATSMESGETINGNWSAIYGADGKATSNALQVEVSLPDGTSGVMADFALNTSTLVVIGGNSYGYLTLNSNGSFSFTAENNLDGQILTFTMGATDGDGDLISDSFKIGINKPVIPTDPDPFAGTGVDESNLSGGTAPDPNALTKVLTVPLDERVDTTGWTAVVNSSKFTFAGANGYLEYDSVTNTLVYIFTTNSTVHSVQGIDTVLDDFGTVTLLDKDDNTRLVPLKVVITDDIPEVVMTGAAGTVESGTVYTGVFTHAFGADGPATAAGVDSLQIKVTLTAGGEFLSDIEIGTGKAVAINGITYGVLTLKADGSFTFASDGRAEGELAFTVGATDGDGDIVWSDAGGDFKITFDPPNPPQLIVGDKDGALCEKNLNEGTVPNTAALTKVLSLTGDDGEKYTVDTTATGWMLVGTSYVMQLDFGSLSWDGTALSYTLSTAMSVVGAGNNIAFETGISKIALLNKNGAPVEAVCQISIEDDTPEASFVVTGNDVDSGKSINGLWEMAFGADGSSKGSTPALLTVTNAANVSITIDVTAGAGSYEVKIGTIVYGTLALDAQGFSFQTKPNITDTLTLSLTVVDGDGDSYKTDDATIKIVKPGGPTDPIGQGVTFDEQFLGDGTASDPSQLVKNIPVPAGFAVYTEADSVWTLDSGTIFKLTGNSGYLLYDSASNTLTFHFTNSISHATGNGDSLFDPSFTVLEMKDLQGNRYPNVSLQINVIDDDPQASLAATSPTTIVSGDEVAGTWMLNFGADGAQQTNGKGIQITVQVLGAGDTVTLDNMVVGGARPVVISQAGIDVTYGTIILNSNGTFTFKAAPNLAAATLSVVLSGTDNDGDTISKEINIVIKAGTGPQDTILGEKNTFDEANLPNGTDANGTALTQVFDIPQNFSLVLGQTGWVNASGNIWTRTYTDIGELKYDADSNTLSFTLTHNYAHSTQGNDLGVITLDKVLLKDALNNEFLVGCQVNVQDDMPTASFAESKYEIASGHLLDGDFSVVFGADGKATAAVVQKITIAIDGLAPLSFTDVETGKALNVTIGGNKFGELTLNSDGTFTFKASPNLNTTLKVTLEAIDSDGDIAKGSTDIVITKPSLPPIPDLGSNPDEAVSESNLSNGTAPASLELTQIFTLPDNYRIQTTGWLKDGNGIFYKETGDYGVLKYDDASRTLSYTLLKATSNHSLPGADTLFVDNVLGVVLVDEYGNTYDVACKPHIYDDMPVVDFVGDTDINLGDANGFNVTGEIEIKSGADGFLNGDATSIKVTLDWEAVGTIPGTGTLDVTIPLDGTVVKQLTELGEVSLKYENGKVVYEYQALKGKATDSEVLNIVAVDTDSDTVKDSITLTLEQDFKGGTVTLDEAGINEIGSNQASSSDIDFLKVLGVGTASEVTKVEWDLTSMPQFLQANGDPNGSYTSLTWKQEGDVNQPTLVAYDANGNTVMTLVPEFINNFFTGRVDATLSGAFKHEGANDKNIEFSIGMNLTNKSGSSYDVAIGVNVKDDTPGGGSGSAEAWVEVNKMGLAPQNVVIVFDASGSINNVDFALGIEAVIELLKTYQSENLEATFSFVAFAYESVVHKSYISAHDLQLYLQNAKAGGDPYSSLREGAYPHSTNYRGSLASAQTLFEKTPNQYQDYEKTVYFISDGLPNTGDPDVSEWQAYCNKPGIDVNTYAIGVTTSFLNNPYSMAALSKVACGNGENIFAVADYSLLLEQLVTIVEQKMEGEMLGSLRSADLTSVVTVQDEGGVWHNFAPGEDNFTVYLGNNVQITIFKDGNYIVTKLGEMNGDTHSTLRLKVVDSDGDQYETALNVICKDVGMNAYDNVAVMQPLYTQGLGVCKQVSSFDSYESSVGLGGSIKLLTTGPTGTTPYLPVVPGTIDRNISSPQKLSIQANSSATAATADISRLQTALGSNYKAMLEEMGIIQQPSDTIGSNAHVSIPVQGITAAGGVIAFNWAFQPGGSRAVADPAQDAAFWVLKNAAGNVVSYGLLHQGNDGIWASGVQYVNLPNIAGNYTMHFMGQNMSENGTSGGKPFWMALNAVYLIDSTAPGVCTGNVITDPSPDGLVDGVALGNFVSKVTINGIDYHMNGGQINANIMDSGVLVGIFAMSDTGSYTYKHVAGYTDAYLDVTYTLLDMVANPPRESSADLHIRSADKTYLGTSGDDIIDHSSLGSASDHSLINAGAGNDLIAGGSGAEVIYGGLGRDTISGNDGDDLIHGGLGNDMLYGNAGNDTIQGDAGNDTIYGGIGNDVLYGGSGDDFLYGGDGNDTLHGGTGVNTLTGGSGADVFMWNNSSFGGHDYIRDFSTAEGDHLSFSDIGGGNPGIAFTYLDSFSLNEAAREVSFTLVKDMGHRDNSLTTVIDITFKQGDIEYEKALAAHSLAVDDYAKEAAVLELIKAITL